MVSFSVYTQHMERKFNCLAVYTSSDCSDTMNYPKKTGFNQYQSRICAYITYYVKTWF